jgi:hypothetical protein
MRVTVGGDGRLLEAAHGDAVFEHDHGTASAVTDDCLSQIGRRTSMVGN